MFMAVDSDRITSRLFMKTRYFVPRCFDETACWMFKCSVLENRFTLQRLSITRDLQRKKSLDKTKVLV